MPNKEFKSLKQLLENMQKMPYRLQQNLQQNAYKPVYRENVIGLKTKNNYNSSDVNQQSFSELKLNEFKNKQKQKQIQDLALKLLNAQKINQKSDKTINQTTNKLKSFLEENGDITRLQSVGTQKRMIKKSDSAIKKPNDIFSGMNFKDALETIKFLDYVSKISNSGTPFKPTKVGNNMNATHAGWTVSEAPISNKNRTPIIGFDIYHPAPSRNSSMKKRANKSKKYFN